MNISDLLLVNPNSFKQMNYPNAKKFKKITQELLNYNSPKAEYATINKWQLKDRDRLIAEKGDVVFCLMNTKKPLVGIIDQTCVVPNSFIVLRPIGVNSSFLYYIFTSIKFLKALSTTKKSFTKKDVLNAMLPYEINNEKKAVMDYLSDLWTTNLILHEDEQTVLDEEFTDLQYAEPLRIKDFAKIYSSNELNGPFKITKNNPNITNHLYQTEDHCNVQYTLLISSTLAHKKDENNNNLGDLKFIIVDKSCDEINLDSNLIAVEINTELLQTLGKNFKKISSLRAAQYLAFYLSTSKMKKDLRKLYKLELLNLIPKLNIEKFSTIQVPLSVKFNDLIENVTDNATWKEPDYYLNTLDKIDFLVMEFESILLQMEKSKSVIHKINPNLELSKIDFGLLLAIYYNNHPNYFDKTVALVFKDFYHNYTFVHQHEKCINEKTISYYNRIEEAHEDILIVIGTRSDEVLRSQQSSLIIIKEE